jgi:CubicO group peptidase (beta-lactamase class C family)
MKKRRFGTTPVILACLLAVACGAATPTAGKPPAYWPTTGWREASPADYGLDLGLPDPIQERAAQALHYLDSLLIVRDGYLIYEAYFNGYNAETLHELASVTKSWTSAILGVAQSDGYLTDLDASLAELLPEYFAGGRHADKASITLRHLLQMRSGLEWDEDTLDTGGYGGPEELLARDVVEWLLSFPMAHPAGTAWNYNTGNTQLVSAAFQRATGRTLAAFAAERLFTPLGIQRYDWLADESGVTIGGQNLRLTPRDTAKLGLLYLRGGQWESQQLVPADWVKQSTTPQDSAFYVPTQETLPIDFYGLHWWLWHDGWFSSRSHAIAAQGYGGQDVLILPRLNLIIVTTAQTAVSPDQANEQRRGIYELILHVILPAVE